MKEVNSLSRRTVLTILVTACTALAGAGDGRANTKESTFLERVYLDRSSVYDPGTIVGILRNQTKGAVALDEITVNGMPVEKQPSSSNPVLWHRITPSRLEPGEFGLIQMKLAQFTHGMLRVRIGIGGIPTETLLGATESESVRVVGIRHSSDGTKVNLFIANNGAKEEKIKQIFLNNHKVWTSDPDGLVIAPGGVEGIHVSLEQPLCSGEQALWLIRLSDRALGCRNRAISGFWTSVESGSKDLADRIGADPVLLESFQFRQEPCNENNSETKPSGTPWEILRIPGQKSTPKGLFNLACVFACPTHATESYHTSAYLAMRAQEEIEKKPGWASFIHACRCQPLQGLSLFGQISDFVRFNAQLSTAVFHARKDRDVVPWTAYQFVKYAVESASPSLAIPMVPVERDEAKWFEHRAPSPVEVRQMVYASLMAGAGGLAYRVVDKEEGQRESPEVLQELRRINREIAEVRDYLTLGFPRPLASVNDPKIQVGSIDALPKGFLVVLINHDVDRSVDDHGFPILKVRDHEDVTVSVCLPKSFSLVKVVDISKGKRQELHGILTKEGALAIPLKSVGATGLILLESSSSLEPVEKDKDPVSLTSIRQVLREF